MVDLESLSAAVASKLSGVASTGPAPTLLTACFSTDPGRLTRLRSWTGEVEADPNALLYPSAHIPPSFHPTLPPASTAANTSTAKPAPPALLDIRITPASATAAFSALFGALQLNTLRTLCVHTHAGS